MVINQTSGSTSVTGVFINGNQSDELRNASINASGRFSWATTSTLDLTGFGPGGYLAVTERTGAYDVSGNAMMGSYTLVRTITRSQNSLLPNGAETVVWRIVSMTRP